MTSGRALAGGVFVLCLAVAALAAFVPEIARLLLPLGAILTGALLTLIQKSTAFGRRSYSRRDAFTKRLGHLIIATTIGVPVLALAFFGIPQFIIYPAGGVHLVPLRYTPLLAAALAGALGLHFWLLQRLRLDL